MIRRWDIITIGNLSRNRYWGERDDQAYRSAICTCTLVQGDSFRLLVAEESDPDNDYEISQSTAFTVPGASAEYIAEAIIFALVAGVGSQVKSASCATGLGSVASFSVHQTTGAVVPSTAGPALAPVAGSIAERAGLSGGEEVLATAEVPAAGSAGEVPAPLPVDSFDDLRWRLMQSALEGQDLVLQLGPASPGGPRELRLPLSQLLWPLLPLPH